MNRSSRGFVGGTTGNCSAIQGVFPTNDGLKQMVQYLARTAILDYEDLFHCPFARQACPRGLSSSNDLDHRRMVACSTKQQAPPT
jgi:hypothetical protein